MRTQTLNEHQGSLQVSLLHLEINPSFFSFFFVCVFRAVQMIQGADLHSVPALFNPPVTCRCSWSLCLDLQLQLWPLPSWIAFVQCCQSRKTSPVRIQLQIWPFSSDSCCFLHIISNFLISHLAPQGLEVGKAGLAGTRGLQSPSWHRKKRKLCLCTPKINNKLNLP